MRRRIEREEDEETERRRGEQRRTGREKKERVKRERGRVREKGRARRSGDRREKGKRERARAQGYTDIYIDERKDRERRVDN